MNLKFLVTIFGTSFGSQDWNQKPFSFLFQIPVTFQPNFEQSVHLTPIGNQIGPRFGHLGPSQTLPRGAHFWDQFGFWPNFFHRVWFTIFCRLAGFFWLAGRILLAFLVRVSGTISGASFWHQVAPKYKDYYSTSNFWSQFWAPVLVPKNGTQNRAVFCSNFRSHFNPILNKVCI